jgi:hypothetical protein
MTSEELQNEFAQTVGDHLCDHIRLFKELNDKMPEAERLPVENTVPHAAAATVFLLADVLKTLGYSFVDTAIMLRKIAGHLDQFESENADDQN